MTAPTPRAVTAPPAEDPRPASRPTTVAGGKAHWDALTTEAIATGGIPWQNLRDGYDPRNVRKAELLPATQTPQGLRSPAQTATTVQLAWWTTSRAVSYRLRRDGADVAGATALTGTTYTDTGRTANTSYSYTVSSVDASGLRSEESPALVVKTSV